MRLLRVLKLARSWHALYDILSKLGKSLKDISYFTILLVLYIYIMALLGMELFANVCRERTDTGDLVLNVTKAYEDGWRDDYHMVAPRDSFDSLGKSLTTVFVLIVGEDWPGIMYNYIRTSAMGINCCPYFLITFSRYLGAELRRWYSRDRRKAR